MYRNGYQLIADKRDCVWPQISIKLAKVWSFTGNNFDTAKNIFSLIFSACWNKKRTGWDCRITKWCYHQTQQKAIGIVAVFFPRGLCPLHWKWLDVWLKKKFIFPSSSAAHIQNSWATWMLPFPSDQSAASEMKRYCPPPMPSYYRCKNRERNVNVNPSGLGWITRSKDTHSECNNTKWMKKVSYFGV